MLEAKRVKDLKNGEYFTRKPIEEPTERQVFIKGGYDRSLKRYECVRWCDCLSTGMFFKDETIVYTGFTF